jgi:predicted DNA-binding transcriptional regulator AlpA
MTESPPAWAPDYVDMAGMAHMLSVSQKQVQRLLSAGRLPKPDLNISGTGGPKGKRWRRDRLMAWLDARRP